MARKGMACIPPLLAWSQPLDHQRLFDLIDRLPDSSSGIQATLADVLDFAHVIPSRLIEPNVVTMRSQIRLLAGPEQARHWTSP